MSSAYSVGNDRKARENEVVLHIVAEQSVQRPSLFLGVIWEEMRGEEIGKWTCKRVQALCREGEPEAACARFSPLLAAQNAAEPHVREMGVADLSSRSLSVPLKM